MIYYNFNMIDYNIIYKNTNVKIIIDKLRQYSRLS